MADMFDGISGFGPEHLDRVPQEILDTHKGGPELDLDKDGPGNLGCACLLPVLVMMGLMFILLIALSFTESTPPVPPLLQSTTNQPQ